MQKISTIIISDEFSTNEVLKLYLSEFSDLELVDKPDNSSNLQDKLLKYEKSILVVDVSNKTEDMLNLIFEVTSKCKNCRVIAISDNPSVDIILKIMRAGAKEFVTSPILKNEFNEVISKIINDFENPAKKSSKCKIITVFSNKGGIGKTSLASNLAIELNKITKENVALIDMNFQMGDITTFLDLKPSFNISYMLENINKINETFLLSTLERYKNTNLYVLADPPYFKQADDIKPSQITKLFATLKDTFSYIVVDAEASFDGKNITVLDNSDMILLVTIANLPALRNTQRCLELFDKLGYDKSKTKVVVNRYMENDEIKEEDVEKVLSKDIYWKIPNNYFALMSAINKGVPVCSANNSSNLAQSYSKLAQYIADNIYKQEMINQFEKLLNNQ